jgi:23S rRNA (guanosine2251-2'-O)-methyltransferase
MSKADQIYGVQPVLEALRAGRLVERVLLARALGGRTQRLREAAEAARVPVVEVGRDELDQRAGDANHQGVLAVLASSGREARGEVDVDAILDRAEAEGAMPLVVLLDGVQDPHNLGAILRSAYALGAHGAVLPKHRAAQITDAVVRASAGAALHIPVAKVSNLKHAMDRLSERGVWLAAAVLDGEPSHGARLEGPLGLVVGGESKGVSPTIAARCDARLSIPLARGFDSLNASVAAGILLYEAVRQRAVPRRGRRGGAARPDEGA